ncbi:S24/S26 family peptidase [Polaribacter haliotis]|uniref:S24/S26 family peptidase n=1 Tax=Polaribacter haliotis TaxID=1888915 RepID=A0A7L8AF30_9FLAO|nr:S24 family peptidase [Polaribacter haliotis]QOD60618.1 S24/S26 family peptidase [Polaribacter haliotis]
MESKKKVILIRKLAEENNITAYDIGKNTEISLTSARNVLEDDNITPRVKTLNIILEYLENAIVGTKNQYELKEEFQSKVTEETVNYLPEGVPYYDVEFAAGFEDFTQNQAIKPTSIILHPFFTGCDFVIRASGQSMAKIIKHGDAIGIKQLDNWQEFLPFGEIYAIVTKDNYRMIKVITKGSTEDYFTLISKPTDNKKEEFPPQEIKKNQIISIFKVQASSYLF